MVKNYNDVHNVVDVLCNNVDQTNLMVIKEHLRLVSFLVVENYSYNWGNCGCSGDNCGCDRWWNCGSCGCDNCGCGYDNCGCGCDNCGCGDDNCGCGGDNCGYADDSSS